MFSGSYHVTSSITEYERHHAMSLEMKTEAKTEEKQTQKSPERPRSVEDQLWT